MNKEQIIEKLNLIFKEVFEDDNLLINEFTMLKDIPNWESLSHMILIVEIENKFNMVFSSTESIEVISVSQIINLILSKKQID
tara:strand:- start:1187 stop:1435 length:249 start_codon:yes stop_codon:yes gene_type:complete